MVSISKKLSGMIMHPLSSVQQKVLDVYHNDGHIKAWNYWKLTGNTYGIFLGEVSSSEFINGEVLANHIGLTEGVLYNVDTPWLKFLLDYEIIYVPMKPLMHSVSWEAIYQCGAVYESNDNGYNSCGEQRIQDANITIDGNVFDITLLHGANVNPTADNTGHDIHATHSSEWNRLIYPIHSGMHNSSGIPSIPSVPYAQWATYSDEELLVHRKFSDGFASWTQETTENNSTTCLIRGLLGVAFVNRAATTATISVLGWRPALRLIQK